MRPRQGACWPKHPRCCRLAAGGQIHFLGASRGGRTLRPLLCCLHEVTHLQHRRWGGHTCSSHLRMAPGLGSCQALGPEQGESGQVGLGQGECRQAGCGQRRCEKQGPEQEGSELERLAEQGESDQVGLGQDECRKEGCEERSWEALSSLKAADPGCHAGDTAWGGAMAGKESREEEVCHQFQGPKAGSYQR